MFNVGIDWAQETRLQYVILSDDGDKVKEGSFDRTLDGIDQVTEAISDVEGDSSSVRVGIDRKHDFVCEMLFSKGFQVFTLTPHSTEAARKAYHPAGDKGDCIDAMLHANIVRKDYKTLQPYRPQKEADVLMYELLKERNSLVDKKKTLKQELNSFLSCYSPILNALSDDLTRKWQKALLKRWPLDQDFLNAHGNALHAFLKNYRMASSTDKKIRDAKNSRSLHHSQELAQSYKMIIKEKVDLIEKLENKILRMDESISSHYKKHRDKEIFSSLPTHSEQTKAAFCIIFDENEKELWNWHNYGAFHGVAPVTKSSGKNKKVYMRRAYDRTINQALINFADSTRRLKNCWAYDYYRKKRATGKAHNETLRQLALKWIKITHAMWRNRTQYDENYMSVRHRQRQKTAA